MRTYEWTADEEPARQIADLTEEARSTGIMVVRFAAHSIGEVPWPYLEAWTRTRAVTVADISATVASPSLEVALLCDVVYVRDGARLSCGSTDEPPSVGLVWACGRAGRRAMGSLLLSGGEIGAAESVALGLAHRVVGRDEDLPLPSHIASAALTALRDLMLSGAEGASALELEHATFRLLFAIGEPAEGARAFLDKRPPDFQSLHDPGKEPAQ